LGRRTMTTLAEAREVALTLDEGARNAAQLIMA